MLFCKKKDKGRSDWGSAFSTISKTLMKKSHLIDLQQPMCADIVSSCSKAFQRSCVDCWSKFFSQRVIKNWNNLPQHVVNSDSLIAIKNTLINISTHWTVKIWAIKQSWTAYSSTLQWWWWWSMHIHLKHLQDDIQADTYRPLIRESSTCRQCV